MPKQLIIESYGTPDTTIVYIDGEEVTNIRDIQFNSTTGDYTSYLNIGYDLSERDELDKTAVNAVITKNRPIGEQNEPTTKDIQASDKKTDRTGIKE